MLEQDAAAAGKLKVFISYSRKDAAFAQELVTGLAFGGFEPYLDQQDIAAGEEWQARLGRLIEAADTVVFVVSPDSVASERCGWEMERTEQLKKRLLPIVWRSVAEAVVPFRLKRLNYIFFDKPHTFAPSLVALATALRTNIGWVREHTRYCEAALRWDVRGRADALLLRGEDLDAAKEWLKVQPDDAPEPTLLTREFISASGDAEVARKATERERLDQMAAILEREKAAVHSTRRWQRLGTLLLGCILLGLIAWSYRRVVDNVILWHYTMGANVLTGATERQHARLRGKEFDDCTNGCPRMVVIEPGRFKMGSPDDEQGRTGNEGPQREVIIARPFAVGKFEVTFEQWQFCSIAGDCGIIVDRGWGRGDRPVINVTWHEAVAYVKWLSGQTGKQYRLLTEAEWEYIARAGSSMRYSFGDKDADLDQYAWHQGNSKGTTMPVGKKEKNAFGLYDTYGNAWEWVQDNWKPTYEGMPTNSSAWEQRGLGPEDLRVIRGGSYAYGSEHLRSAYRDQRGSSYRTGIGFRVARDLPE